jgi:hypothetical protein
MRDVLFNGNVLQLYSREEAEALAKAGFVAGKSISSINMLRNAFRFEFVFPELLVGFWENPRNSSVWLYSYFIVWRSELYQVHIELNKCGHCNLRLIGCSVRDFDLYLDSQCAEMALEKARGLPFISCPKCSSELPRKYLAAYVVEEHKLHFAS